MVELTRRMKAVADDLLRQAATITDRDERKRLQKVALKMQSKARLTAAIDLAKSEPAIAIKDAEFDKHPMLLNVQNGVVDLTTGKLRSHSRDDYMTRICDASYYEDADCALFKAVLERSFSGDQEMIAFYQRALGYGITGCTSEQCLFLLFGKGANGKGVTINPIKLVLGSYARQAQAETFLSMRKGGAASPDLARLAGIRFVAISELNDGGDAASALLKQCTGGDTLTARQLYEQDFEFMPSFKLFIATNHKLRFDASDDAIWRRIHQIPFLVVIPPDERDPHLATKLLQERDGILRWLVQGAVEWHRGGLQVPAKVREATAAYRREIDPLGHFIAECCDVHPDASASAALLINEYEHWCKAEALEPGKAQWFGQELSRRGFGREKRGGVSYRTGLRLRPRTALLEAA